LAEEIARTVDNVLIALKRSRRNPIIILSLAQVTIKAKT